MIKLVNSQVKDLYLKLIVSAGIVASLVQVAAISSLSASPTTHSRFKLEYLPNVVNGIKSMIPLGKPLGAIVAALAVVYGVYLIKKGYKEEIFVNLLAPLSFYSAASILASLSMSGGSRYALPVYCGIATVIAAGLSLRPGAAWNKAALGIAILLLSVQIKRFFDTSYVYDPSWPNWKHQLENRDYSSNLEVDIFPQWKGWEWKMEIPPGSGRKPLYNPTSKKLLIMTTTSTN